MAYCSVWFCQSPETHNALSHQCGKCGGFGCHKNYKVNKIPVDKQCNVPTCKHKETHTMKGHKCRLCNKYGHGFTECGCHDFDVETAIKLIKEDKYFCYYPGMGNAIIYKNVDGKVEKLFVDQNDWGQYDGVGNLPEIREFIKGFKPLRVMDNMEKYL